MNDSRRWFELFARMYCIRCDRRAVALLLAVLTVVLLQHRQTGFDDAAESLLRSRKPVYQLSHWGIPLIGIYAR